jgi:hypothetical protein
MGCQNKNQTWLTGWKAIANYFGVYWRTVQKWHKIYSMPVLRTPTGQPTNTPQELDAWMIEMNKKNGS